MEVSSMYFPYLRGRQFELIALRELVEEEMRYGRRDGGGEENE